MAKIKILWVVIIVMYSFLIIVIFNTTRTKKITEHFDNDYLYPTTGLGEKCKAKGLAPSYMPMLCNKADGTSNPYSNCECVDKDGMCAVCYEPLTKYQMYAGKIFDPSPQDDDLFETDKTKNNVTMNTFNNSNDNFISDNK